MHAVPRAYAGIAIECTESYGNLIVMVRVAAEEGRAAIAAEQLGLALGRDVRANLLLAYEEAKARPRDPSAYRRCGPGAPLAVGAMAVAGGEERRGDLKAHSPT